MAKPRYKTERNTGNRSRGKSDPKSGSKPGFKPGNKPQHRSTDTAAIAKNNAIDSISKTKPLLPPRRQYEGARLNEKTGIVLETLPTPNYALLDSGNGEKLERYGPLIIRRPEGQAIWQPSLKSQEWDNADATFTGDTDEEGQGRWRYKDEVLPATWPLDFDGIPFFGRFTSFRHTGVFPEQAAHWFALQKAIQNANLGRPVRMLNLFGYTGLASLVAARAGAEVTHVDASKKAIGWAQENQKLAGLQDKPVRWICDDAVKFCAREERREQTYDVILLDPPSYGRGPKGEVWHLFEHLPHMLDLVRALQSDRPLMTVLTAYAIRASHFAIHEVMQEVMAGMNGTLESGELILRQEADQRALSTSMFSRFVSKECAR